MTGINVASVQFRRAGKLYDFSYKDLDLKVGEYILVDSEKGPSPAEVMRLKFLQTEEKGRKLKPIIRKISHRELNKPTRWSEEEVLSVTQERVDHLELKMNLLSCEIHFNNQKIIVYFSAPERVDFRTLVKDLATKLKTRIELKQVGARDETKLLGGIGICGREFCCSSFLRTFVPVSIKMAKNQNLALNPSKVSGGCGRLLCCLTYENDTYTDLHKSTPKRNAKVKIKESGDMAQVIKADLLNQTVLVKLESEEELQLKTDEIEIIPPPGGSNEGQKKKKASRPRKDKREPKTNRKPQEPRPPKTPKT